MRIFKRRSVSSTIVLSSISVALSIALVVGWILVIVQNMSSASAAVATNAWLLVGGILSFVVITTVLVLFTVFLVHEILEARRQTSFIDSVTHELKSPLASLKLCAETLARPKLNASQSENLRGMILDDVNRLVTVIDGILEASRIGQDRRSPAVSRVLIRPLLKDAVVAMRRRHRLETEIRVDVPEASVLLTNANALRTVVENLIDNAIKYSGSEPHIAVRGYAKAGKFEIEVRDQGIGIATGDLERVFNRFYRVPEEAVRSRHGTGLGLFVVSALVRDLGGRVRAESEGVGRGTTVRVVLPSPPGP